LRPGVPAAPARVILTAGVAVLAYALYRTAEIRDGPGELDPKLAALLAVAREIAGSTGYVTDATWQAGPGCGLERYRACGTVRPRGGKPVHQLLDLG